MAVEIVMPKLGWTMEEGILVEWIKRDGDPVQPGDILFTVESDKALNEVESFEAGILRIPPDSDVVGKPLPVGTLLAYIVQPGEALPFDQPATVGTTIDVVMKARTTHASSLHDSSLPPSSATTTSASTHSGWIGELPTISPRARRIAAELGVEWAALTGSGRTGRIVERDVRAAALASPNVAARAAMATPMAQTNQSNVEGVAASTQPSTSICLTTEADATELVRLNQRIGAAWRKPDQPAPTIDDLLAKLVAAALKEYPQFETRLADSTFAIMHLGIYEIDAFTPAIGASQSAVLGVGRILAKQVVIDAQKEHVAIRQMMFLSLTCDARIVDVVSAARLLHLIKQYVEQPLIWLVN